MKLTVAGAEQAKLTVCFCASALNRCCARHGHGVCGMCWLVEHHHTGASFVPGHGCGTAGDGTWLELWNYGIDRNITSHDAQLQFCNMWACSSVGKSKPCNRDTPPPPPSEASISQGMLSTRYPHTSASGEAGPIKPKGPWMRQQHVESVIGLHPQVRAVTCIILLWPLQLLPCSQLTPPL